MREQQEIWRKNLAQQDYRKFLSEFKVDPCSNTQHLDQFCFCYHSESEQQSSPSNHYAEPFSHLSVLHRDRRRNPYGPLNQIVYAPQQCRMQGSNCKGDQCKFCHNVWELNYHPLVFKTQQCQYFYDCAYEFCNRVHYCDIMVNPKTQAVSYRFSEFFRFDILTFKTQPCKKEYSHDKYFCLNYHNQGDYRRPNFDQYDHILCKKANGESCHAADCEYAHNKIEQLYHPSRYKSKFCEDHYTSRKTAENPNDQSSFKSLCPFDKFCSFAHNESEISIQLIDKWPKNLEFYLYAYKTVWCPITTDHNRSLCDYAHNIQDYRRNPKEHHYEHVDCPYWKKNDKIKSIEEAGCPNGMQCTKCHGWKQREYHPMVYCKTKPHETKNKEKAESMTASDGAKDKTQSSYAKDVKAASIKDQAISKKLGAGLSNKNKIEAIIKQQLSKGAAQMQRQLYGPGTPFFKNNHRNGKIKSQSEKGEVSKADPEQKISQVEERGSFQTSDNILPNSGITSQQNIASEHNMLLYSLDEEDAAMFRAFQKPSSMNRQGSSDFNKNFSENGHQQTLTTQKFVRTVSKSVGCRRAQSQPKFSKDLTETLNPQILGVLQQKNISEIKLVNMREEDIAKIQELTESQKTLIIKKVIMRSGSTRKTPTYEEIFEKFFIKHRRKELLGKMKHRKVKQERLLLMDSEIKDLSFLSESEKRILPEILSEFKDNQDFQSLREDILKSVAKGFI